MGARTTERVLRYIRENPYSTPREIASGLRVARATVQIAIEQLKDEGRIEAKNP